MAKTVVQKVESPDPDATIFKISGTLGFHENKVLAKFFDECSSRSIHNLVIDFSDLGSLGGGCAKIIREAAEGGRVRLVIAGASRTVLGFLQNGESGPIEFVPDVEQALAALRAGSRTGSEERSRPAPRPSESAPEPVAEGRLYAADVLTEVDDLLGVSEDLSSPPGDAGGSKEPCAASSGAANTDTACAVAEPKTASRPAAVSDETREIKRKLVRYRALFSLNKEFGRIEEKSRLLDAFLLSTIAQVGVESAAFLEFVGDEFVAACWKGFETADPKALNVRGDEVDMGAWLRSAEIFPLAGAPISAGARARLEKWDLPYAAPFLVHGSFRGIVLDRKSVV